MANIFSFYYSLFHVTFTSKLAYQNKLFMNTEIYSIFYFPKEIYYVFGIVESTKLFCWVNSIVKPSRYRGLSSLRRFFFYISRHYCLIHMHAVAVMTCLFLIKYWNRKKWWNKCQKLMLKCINVCTFQFWNVFRFKLLILYVNIKMINTLMLCISVHCYKQNTNTHVLVS